MKIIQNHKVVIIKSKFLSSRNLNISNSDSPQLPAERLDQIGEEPRRPSPFGKRGCLKGDSVRVKRAPIWFIIIPIAVLLLTSLASAQTQQIKGWEMLFQDDFEDSNADDWELEAGWEVEQQDNNYLLKGVGHKWVRLNAGRVWTDYSFKTRVKLIKGDAHLNYRVSNNGRYFIGFYPHGLYLNKETPWGTFYDLINDNIPHQYNKWYTVEIIGQQGEIKIYVNGKLRLEYIDANPLVHGRIAFETLENSQVYFDDVEIFGKPLPAYLSGYAWTRLGGPSGGLGYDVRIHPLDKNIMFVTDNPSGVNKSYDAGTTWEPKNKGIKDRTGPSFDGIPNFCLTIDPNNPDIIWAGMQYARGIYKSIDGGETWVKKAKGILDGNEITFRGFGIQPNNSNVVFAGAEITTGSIGREHDRAKGKIFKTEDGGENWRTVWEGDSLARFVLFDYQNPQTLYASTGIFDREAFNDIGVGILKSTDNGESWFEINNGIPAKRGDRFCGFLEMHPQNPEILFAACGNISNGPGGVFKTINGGMSWKKVLSGGKFGKEMLTVVVISPSDPDIVYAGNDQAFYRSEDGGNKWKRLWKKDEGTWGPPGIRPGFPISAVVVPDDPYTVFVNNYMGGNFKSIDGAKTWINSSTGYTGAHMHEVAIDSENPGIVYSVARSGPFQSFDGGQTWKCLAFQPLARASEWSAVCVNPQNSKEILISDEFQGYIFKTSNGGQSWKKVFKHPMATEEDPQEDRHGFKAIAYALSNPDIVYAGMRKGRRTINGDFPARPSFGMYKSIDEGETWKQINSGIETSLININCIAVHPDNPDVVYIGTWQDGIFKTIDGGQNWVLKSNGLRALDVRSLAIDPKNPDIVYAGLGQGVGIFKTSNAGEIWQPINQGISLSCPPSLLPVGRASLGISIEEPAKMPLGQDYYSIPWTSIWSIVVDPNDSNKIYAADHQSGVYVSMDKGKNWHPINQGLTTRAVNSLAISNDGKVLYAATEGEGTFRMGTVEPVKISQVDVVQPKISKTVYLVIAILLIIILVVTYFVIR